MSEREIAGSPVSRPRFFYGYVVVAAAFIIILAVFGVRYAFGVFFLPMLKAFGWTRAMTSGAFSLSIAVEGALSVVMGMLTDRVGPRVVIILSGFFIGLGYLLMSQVNALWHMYIFYGVVVGIGMGGIMVVLLSTVARWFVERRGLMSGVVLTGTGAGALITAPIANQLIAAYDWRVSYMILGGTILIVVLSAAQFLKRDPAKMGQVPDNRIDGEEALAVTNGGFSFMEALRTRQFWLVLGMDFFYGFFEFAVIVHIAPHASGLGIPAAGAAGIVATLGAVQIAGRVALGSTADRIGSKRAFMIGFVLSTAVLLGLVQAREVWMLFLLAAVFGLAAGGIGSLASPVVAELFGLSSHGLILGVTVLGFTVGAATGPLLAGFIFDITRSYQLAFVACAGAGVLGFVLSVFLTPIRSRLQVKEGH